MTARVEVWKTWGDVPFGGDLWEWQDGRCAMCGTDKFGLVRDHCHLTGLIRGLLCSGCNVREGVSWHPMWEGWREGDTPARALGYVEVYLNHLGVTPIAPQSALTYYTWPERVAWWESLPKAIAMGMEWPTEAPWTDEATARRDEEWERMRSAVNSALGRALSGLFPKDGAA